MDNVEQLGREQGHGQVEDTEAEAHSRHQSRRRLLGHGRPRVGAVRAETRVNELSDVVQHFDFELIYLEVEELVELIEFGGDGGARLDELDFEPPRNPIGMLKLWARPRFLGWADLAGLDGRVEGGDGTYSEGGRGGAILPPSKPKDK